MHSINTYMCIYAAKKHIHRELSAGSGQPVVSDDTFEALNHFYTTLTASDSFTKLIFLLSYFWLNSLNLKMKQAIQ